MEHNKTDAFDVLFVSLLIWIAICANIGLFAGAVPQFDLFLHFQVQYLALFMLLAVVFLFRKSWTLLAITVVCMSLPLSKIAPWYIGAPEQATPAFQILSSNVKATNTNTQGIETLIIQEDAEIVILLEATRMHQDSLEDIEQLYPYTFSHSLESGSGFLLYSKFPLANIEYPVNGPSGMVSVAATVHSPNGEFDLIAVHPIRPGPRHGSTLRDAEMKQITELLQNRSANAVVIGDLNTTMWTTSYSEFVEHNNLRNASKGRGIVPTWRVKVLGPLLAIPIDHCFVRGNVQDASLTAHTLYGTDHEAIIAGISMQ